MDLRTPLMDLGRVGVWSNVVVRVGAAETRRLAAGVEELGFRCLWFPESVGKEAFSTAATILHATERLVVATGIANLWARDPLAAVAGASTLAEAFPNRFVLGLGVSHAPQVTRRGHHYRRPLETMQRYLDAMETTPYVGPDPGFPVVLAALGPKMLTLAAERTSGAHPYFVPVEHTRFAREVLGPDAFLAPEQAVVPEADPETARRIARVHTARYLAADNYRRNLQRMGRRDPDLAGGGSDSLVDAVVAWGDDDTIAARIRSHLDGGADHVAVQVFTEDPDESPLPHLERLTRRLDPDRP